MAVSGRVGVGEREGGRVGMGGLQLQRLLLRRLLLLLLLLLAAARAVAH